VGQKDLAGPNSIKRMSNKKEMKEKMSKKKKVMMIALAIVLGIALLVLVYFGGKEIGKLVYDWVN
jgi:hypothetical protein